ncbi:MAG TPA: hypothetical protein VJM50_01065 [Pyrinomonadaceae bacterium]|nr:hypothetical protein [Pyrinomonadaceae bacterium]
MESTANSQSRRLKTWPWHSSIAGVLLAAAFVYVWIVPLFRPRGFFLWGHYRLKDIYLGIPIALAAICFLLVLLVPARYKRPVSLRLITFGIGLLVAFAICDAVYAFGIMGISKPNYWLDQAHISRRYSAADHELGFSRKPWVSWRGYVPELNRIVEYHTDENGFRNSTKHGQADIVFIGDSFTEAAQVEEGDTFVQRVAKASGLSAVNLASGAYGPQQELIVLKRYGLPYKPRFVVWQLFEGNDLTDAEAFAEWKKNPEQVIVPLKDRYLDNSLLHQMLTNTRSQEPAGPMATLFHHDGTSRRISLRYRYEPDQPLTMHTGMTETLTTIEAGQQLCQSRGIQLLVVVVPTMVRVMEPYITFSRFEDRREFFPERIPGDKDFSDTVEEFCTQIGCGFVDSFEAMRDASRSDNRGLYIPTDEHLDTRGHEVMSKVIGDWILSKKNTGIP